MSKDQKGGDMVDFGSLLLILGLRPTLTFLSL